MVCAISGPFFVSVQFLGIRFRRPCIVASGQNGLCRGQNGLMAAAGLASGRRPRIPGIWPYSVARMA